MNSMFFPRWIRNDILSKPIYKSDYIDRLVWPYMDNGKFTVKSCYKLLYKAKGGCGMLATFLLNQIEP